MAQLRAKQIKLAAADDILIGGASGNGTVLSKGASGTVLKVLSGGALGYEKVAAADTTFSDASFTATNVAAALIEAKALASTNASGLEQEITDREAGDDAVTAAFTAADEVLQDAIDAEELRATTEEGAIRTDFAAADAVVTAAYIAADAVVAGTVTTLAGRVTTAEGDIDALQAADVVHDDRLDALEASVGGAGIGAEIDAIETSIGLNADGTFDNTGYAGSTHATVAASGTNTVAGKILALDTIVKAAEDAATAVTTRVTTAEGDIDDLEGRVTAVEGDVTVLEGALADEVQDRIDGDAAEATARDAAILVETNRATAAEDAIASDLADEVSRATGAESTLTTNLASEVTRATEAEEALDDRVTALESAVGDNIGELQDEVDRVEAALGLDADGTTADFTSLNYILAGDTFKGAIDKLDGALKSADTAYKAADDDLQQQINSLVGLDTMVFKGVIDGTTDATALAVIEADAETGDVYRVSVPSATFADQAFDVNVGDFVAYIGAGAWVKFDNTDPTLVSTDAGLVVTGNTFTGFSLDLDRKVLSSADSAITVTGGTDAVLTAASLQFNPGNVNFSALAQVNAPGVGQEGKFLKWTSTGLAYVSAAEVGATVKVDEDFAPVTAANAAVTLGHTPTGDVSAFINGVKLKKAGYTVVGTALTLVDASNGYGIETGDTLSVSYSYSA